jgi:hypothetical protein
MGLKRRTFLQRAGLALTALGVSEIGLSFLGDKSLAVPLLDRYLQALAQPGGRKLALLVGINQYPSSIALGGCVTDVDLQRELLIYRFGFSPSDVLVLTDSQATREHIETAFIEHLTEQAKPEDVVVFHFSGYGSRIESQNNQSVSIQNTLVPVDGIPQTKEPLLANDVLEETLVLLLRSLKTDRVTTVLDTSYTIASHALQGNLRVRSCPNPPAQGPSPGELAFQDQMLLRLKSSPEQLKNPENRNQMPGIVLAAAGPRQLAREAQWPGFSAGLFTYALTQHLWQASSATTIQISLSRAAGTVNQLVGKEQQPQLVNPKSLQQPLLAYYVPSDPNIGADGVVTAVDDNSKTVQLWLAGLPATVLEYYGINSLLSLSRSQATREKLNVEDSQNNLQLAKEQPVTSSTLPGSTLEKPQLQLRSKEGLTARARMISTNIATDNYQLQVGQLIQEAVRMLPRNIALTIALDSSLERIERVDATSAFANIPGVSSVVIAGEQPADYVFGKLRETPVTATVPTDSPLDSAAIRTESSDSSLKTGGYGLFYLASDPIHDTFGAAGEAVKSSVNRLLPKLTTLLAAKFLRLTANEGSSRLGVRASLEIVAPQATLVMQRETLRAFAFSQGLTSEKTDRNLTTRVGEGSIPTLRIGSRIRYRLENYSDRPIYFLLLGFDTNSSAIALYEMQSFEEVEESEKRLPLQDGVIAPGQALTLPQSPGVSDWVIPGPAGLVEMQLICSRAPFTKTLKALDAARRPKGEGQRIADVFNPLQVAQAVLQDLHNASVMNMAETSSYTPDSASTASDIYTLDVNAWATLSFIYQVA